MTKTEDREPKKARYEAATTIIQNATRLYADAKYLFEDKRYASAMALLVTSIEEFGKFLHQADYVSSRLIEKRLHMRKQHLALRAFLQLSYYGAALDYFKKQGCTDTEAWTNAQDYIYMREENMDGDIFSEIVETDAFQEAISLYCLFQNGELHKLKNDSLYVDVTDEARIVRTPTCITEKQVAAIFRSYDVFLGLVRNRLLS